MLDVGLPFPKNQVRKLGERLRAAGIPSGEDLEMLHTLLAAYDEALATAVAAVRDELGYAASPRLKNEGTIIEKLRRNRHGTLGNIQDLAGMRIVLETSDVESKIESVRPYAHTFRTTTTRPDSQTDA